jgi:hypothetical protein
MGNRLLCRRQLAAVRVAPDFGSVLSGLEARAGRPADRLARKRIFESNTFGSEVV